MKCTYVYTMECIYIQLFVHQTYEIRSLRNYLSFEAIREKLAAFNNARRLVCDKE